MASRMWCLLRAPVRVESVLLRACAGSSPSPAMQLCWRGDPAVLSQVPGWVEGAGDRFLKYGAF